MSSLKGFILIGGLTMKFVYGDEVIVSAGFHKGRRGEVVGKFLIWTDVLFDNQQFITHTILTCRLTEV